MLPKEIAAGLYEACELAMDIAHRSKNFDAFAKWSNLQTWLELNSDIGSGEDYSPEYNQCNAVIRNKI